MIIVCSRHPSGDTGADDVIEAPGVIAYYDSRWIGRVYEERENGATILSEDVSADRGYLECCGNDVFMYSFECPGCTSYRGAGVRAGRLDAGRIIFSDDTIGVTITDTALITETRISEVRTGIMNYTVYEGTLPSDVRTNYTTLDDDLYEPDDNMGIATILLDVGVPQLHTQPGADTDWFILELSPVRIYDIIVDGGWGSYADGTFYNLSGAVVNADDNVFAKLDQLKGNVFTLKVQQAKTVYFVLENAPVYRILMTSQNVYSSPYSGHYYQSYWSQTIEYTDIDSTALYEYEFTYDDFTVLFKFTDSSLTRIYSDTSGIVQSSRMLAYLGGNEFRFDCEPVAMSENGAELSYQIKRDGGTRLYTWTYKMKPYSGEYPPSQWLE